MSKASQSKIHEVPASEHAELGDVTVHRRTWSSKEKLKVLDELDHLRGESGESGAYLRRRGLYASTVSGWRKQRSQGLLGVESKKRGPKARLSKEQVELVKVERENAQLKKELALARKLIEIQKKVASMLQEEL